MERYNTTSKGRALSLRLGVAFGTLYWQLEYSALLQKLGFYYHWSYPSDKVRGLVSRIGLPLSPKWLIPLGTRDKYLYSSWTGATLCCPTRQTNCMIDTSTLLLHYLPLIDDNTQYWDWRDIIPASSVLLIVTYEEKCYVYLTHLILTLIVCTANRKVQWEKWVQLSLS